MGANTTLYITRDAALLAWAKANFILYDAELENFFNDELCERLYSVSIVPSEGRDTDDQEFLGLFND